SPGSAHQRRGCKRGFDVAHNTNSFRREGQAVRPLVRQTEMERIVAGEQITLKEALEYIGQYRANPLATSIKGWLIEASNCEAISNQAECSRGRDYLARTEAGELTLVLVGVTNEGRDITEGVIAEKGLPCPPYCDIQSTLLE